MDNRSFSLQFNPLMNVKCVKDYEEEIAQLKAENFDLKAQLTHSNIPKVLYESKQEMDLLLAQKQELQNSLENLSRAYENVHQEKRVLENKYGQEISMANEKNSLLEDENKRLVHRLEKLNKEIQERLVSKGEQERVTEAIRNQERENEQLRYSFEQRIGELKSEFERYRREAEEEIKKKEFDVEMARKKLDAVMQKEKNNSLIISDLKATLNAQKTERSMIDELKAKENALREEKEAVMEKIQREHGIYMAGMEKFRSIITQKLAKVAESLVGVSEKLSQTKMKCYISEENRNLISRMNVKYSSINDIILFFKMKHGEMYKKMEALRKEAQASRSGAEKKTQAILQEFKNQFSDAKNELLVCKRYLEKKAAENKALRTENARLLGEAQKKGGMLRNVYEMGPGMMKI